jgi:Protein of unknown function (DUF3631)
MPDQLPALLNDVVDYLKRFVVLNGAQADALALWVFHTHTFQAAEATPYIQITSAEKRSGKTRLLDVLSQVVASPWKVISPTEATLFRFIDAEQPTLFLEEYDTVFSSKDYEGLRAILNAGFQPGTPVPRVSGDGHHRQVEMFNVYCPKAMAGIGELPDTVADRSIRIELKRRKASERVERARRRFVKEYADPVRGRLEATVTPAIEDLANAFPEIPSELDDRAADIWEPLIAIADLAGELWPARARRAAVALAASELREEESQGLVLLRDIRRALLQAQLDRVSTRDLIRRLAEDQESAWADWWDAREDAPAKGSQRQLARLLKPYGITSRTLRIDSTQAKGFDRAAFSDAWARYLAQERVESVPSVPNRIDPEIGAGGTDGTDIGPSRGSRPRLSDPEIFRLLETHHPTVVARDDFCTREERYGLALLYRGRERANERRTLVEANELVTEGIAEWKVP